MFPRIIPQPGDGPHVLVMDDDLSMLQVMKILFADEGWRISTSLHALDLDEIRVLAPDVIVFDLLFNHRPLGWERLRQLRRCRELATTPVVVCTAAPELAQRLVAQSAAPGVRLIDKPFDIDDLVRAVRESLDGRAARNRTVSWPPKAAAQPRITPRR